MALPQPDALDRARLLVAPGVTAPVALALEQITGRPAERVDTPPDEPFLYVGDVLPDAWRDGRLVWFHSVNAGTDALLGSGQRPWPREALLTRTVGRMGERIAQYVLGWVLADCQAVPEYAAQHARAEWRRLPTELAAGRTAAVYGTGHIGSAVGDLLRACGIRTVGVGRTPRTASAGFGSVVEAGSDEESGLLADARWVVSTLPLTGRTELSRGTEGFFSETRFSTMRGPTFINIGRGATVDMTALRNALLGGAVRRAVLDVLPVEPAGPGDPVWRLPHTVVTSHSAGITTDEDVVADFAACWKEVGAGRVPQLAVDVARGY